jgi:hypothetical protein
MKVIRFVKNRLSLLNVLSNKVFNQQLIDSSRTVVREKSWGGGMLGRCICRPVHCYLKKQNKE